MSTPLETRIASQWDSYRRDVVPARAPLIQLQETRRAFYAGAWAALQLLAAVSSDDVSEDAGAAYIESLHQECRDFVASMLRGES